jgi:hypothetical protein
MSNLSPIFRAGERTKNCGITQYNHSAAGCCTRASCTYLLNGEFPSPPPTVLFSYQLAYMHSSFVNNLDMESPILNSILYFFFYIGKTYIMKFTILTAIH